MLKVKGKAVLIAYLSLIVMVGYHICIVGSACETIRLTVKSDDWNRVLKGETVNVATEDGREFSIRLIPPYNYEFLLPGAVVYTFEYERRLNVDTTVLDYFIMNEFMVEPIGISIACGSRAIAYGSREPLQFYTEITIHMPSVVDRERLKEVIERVASGEYTLSADECDRWGMYMKEERRYPIINVQALQEFIRERMGIDPVGVTAGGVKIIVHMPQPIERAQLEEIVNEFLQQNDVEWINPVSKP